MNDWDVCNGCRVRKSLTLSDLVFTFTEIFAMIDGKGELLDWGGTKCLGGVTDITNSITTCRALRTQSANNSLCLASKFIQRRKLFSTRLSMRLRTHSSAYLTHYPSLHHLASPKQSCNHTTIPISHNALRPNLHPRYPTSHRPGPPSHPTRRPTPSGSPKTCVTLI